tara:strand:- start:8 stop:637 length:630 start_codon:yes stop_codon:yes gene_type:complete
MTDFDISHYNNVHEVSIKMGHALYDVFEPTTVEDYGCGIGSMLLGLKQSGAWPVFGHELVKEAKENAPVDIRGRVNICNIFAPQFKTVPGSDLTLCLEMVERLPPESSDAIIKILCQSTSSAGFIVFSTPTTPDDNPSHINIQPIGKWLIRFYEYDFLPDIDVYDKLLAAWTEIGAPANYLKNMRVLRRGARLGKESDAKGIASSIVRR